MRPLLAPGTCWICDMSPIQEAHKVIDTRRNARPGGPTSHASVRKYICEPCAREMGGAMGMVDDGQHASVVEALADARAEAARVTAELERVRSQQTRVVPMEELSDGFIAAAKDAVMEVVRDELAKQAKPAPRKRAAASDE